jgi:hypothetical protein
MVQALPRNDRVRRRGTGEDVLATGPGSCWRRSDLIEESVAVLTMTVVREEDFADVAEQDVDSLFVGQESFFGTEELFFGSRVQWRFYKSPTLLQADEAQHFIEYQTAAA